MKYELQVAVNYYQTGELTGQNLAERLIKTGGLKAYQVKYSKDNTLLCQALIDLDDLVTLTSFTQKFHESKSGYHIIAARNTLGDGEFEEIVDTTDSKDRDDFFKNLYTPTASDPIHNEQLKIYDFVGNTNFTVRRYDASLAGFQKALKLHYALNNNHQHPQIAHYLFYLAASYLELKNTEESLFCASEAVEIANADPTFDLETKIKYLVLVVSILMIRGEYVQAKKILDICEQQYRSKPVNTPPFRDKSIIAGVHYNLQLIQKKQNERINTGTDVVLRKGDWNSTYSYSPQQVTTASDGDTSKLSKLPFPYELLLIIANYLDDNSLIRLCKVSKQWYPVAHEFLLTRQTPLALKYQKEYSQNKLSLIQVNYPKALLAFGEHQIYASVLNKLKNSLTVDSLIVALTAATCLLNDTSITEDMRQSLERDILITSLDNKSFPHSISIMLFIMRSNPLSQQSLIAGFLNILTDETNIIMREAAIQILPSLVSWMSSDQVKNLLRPFLRDDIDANLPPTAYQTLAALAPRVPASKLVQIINHLHGQLLSVLEENKELANLTSEAICEINSLKHRTHLTRLINHLQAQLLKKVMDHAIAREVGEALIAMMRHITDTDIGSVIILFIDKLDVAPKVKSIQKNGAAHIVEYHSTEVLINTTEQIITILLPRILPENMTTLINNLLNRMKGRNEQLVKYIAGFALAGLGSYMPQEMLSYSIRELLLLLKDRNLNTFIRMQAINVLSSLAFYLQEVRIDLISELRDMLDEHTDYEWEGICKTIIAVRHYISPEEALNLVAIFKAKLATNIISVKKISCQVIKALASVLPPEQVIDLIPDMLTKLNDENEDLQAVFYQVLIALAERISQEERVSLIYNKLIEIFNKPERDIFNVKWLCKCLATIALTLPKAEVIRLITIFKNKLDDEFKVIRVEVCTSLTILAHLIPKTEAIELITILLNFIHDEDKSICSAACETIAKITSHASHPGMADLVAQQLLIKFRDKNVGVREAAKSGLVLIAFSFPEQTRPIINDLKNSSEPSAIFIHTLCNINQSPDPKQKMLAQDL